MSTCWVHLKAKFTQQPRRLATCRAILLLLSVDSKCYSQLNLIKTLHSLQLVALNHPNQRLFYSAPQRHSQNYACPDFPLATNVVNVNKGVDKQMYLYKITERFLLNMRTINWILHFQLSIIHPLHSIWYFLSAISFNYFSFLFNLIFLNFCCQCYNIWLVLHTK